MRGVEYPIPNTSYMDKRKIEFAKPLVALLRKHVGI